MQRIWCVPMLFWGRSYPLGFLSLDGEHNLPSMFSTALLWCNAVLLGCIGWAEKDKRFSRIYWVGLSLAFLAAGLDESIMFHERVSDEMERFIDTSGLLHFAWIIPYAVFVLLFAVIYCKFFFRMPSDTRRHVALAGFTYLTGAVGLDTRNNPYYPQHGFFVQGTARSWSSNGFESYLETSADTRVFVPLPIRKHVLALRAWGRKVDGPTNLDNILFFGGPETVRGYPFGQREGEEGYLLTAEYRVPLFLMPISPRGEIIGAGIHLFTDVGDAWYHGAEAGRSEFSYGAGFHLNIDTLQLLFQAARTREGDWMFEFMDKFNF